MNKQGAVTLECPSVIVSSREIVIKDFALTFQKDKHTDDLLALKKALDSVYQMGFSEGWASRKTPNPEGFDRPTEGWRS